MTFKEFKDGLKNNHIDSFVYLYNTNANPNANLTELFIISKARYTGESYLPGLSSTEAEAGNIILDVDILHMNLPIKIEHLDLQNGKFKGFVISENEYDNGFVLVGDKLKRFKRFLIKDFFDKGIKYISLNDILHYL